MGQAVIHGEAGPVPVAGDAQLLKLALYRARILFFPLPGPFKKLLASKFLFINTLVFQLIRDLNLRGNRRMVRPRHPQRIISLHSLITD